MEKYPADAALADAALLTRIVQRDPAALSTLYDRYVRIIYGLAFKSLRSAEESEEVVLDVFAQVWRIADRYDPKKGRVDSWLFNMARSRTIDRLRKLQRSHPAAPIQDLELQDKSDRADLFADLFIQERRKQVIAALKAIPHEQRVVLELAYYQGLSQSEIAAQMNLPIGTVKTRTRLGLSKLKAVLGSNEDL
jgi:RNA polymerase sigma factor (sigma-70 family)